MSPRRVRESAPVQVYLAKEEQRRLEHLAELLGETKSEILRRGLLALERELTDPEEHPALRLIGLDRGAPDPPGLDVARNHDKILADDEEASWSRTTKPRKSRGR